MPETSGFSQIVPVFDESLDYSNSLLYKDVMINTLQKILPKSFLQDDFLSKLPLVASLPGLAYCDKVPCQLSFYVVAKYRPNAFKFFLEMISRWLVPGKQLNVVLLYTADFRLSENDKEIYSVCEVKLKIEEPQDLEVIRLNLPMIETELRLGMGSSYYARRIMELKGLYPEEKTALIHEKVAHSLKRFPKMFQNDLFSEMQHVSVLCREEFKEARLSTHLSKIIHLHYLYRRSLRESSSKKREVRVKLFSSKLYHSEKKRSVLSVVVGVNRLGEKEVFDENRLMATIQSYFPNASLVERSYFANRRGSEKVSIFYMEIEKKDGTAFTLKERQLLQKQLPKELKERIEPMMHPVFMPCNEEEIMRNILSLSHQIRYLRDVPQVFISFDQQSPTDLYFTVIVVRLLKPGTLSIREMFKQSGSSLNFIHDRCKKVGLLRKKYPKEASVFRLSLSKVPFVRKDQSIDLHKARHGVVKELTKVLGEIRDYNGGMISKQHELLSDVKTLLNGQVVYDELQLENFFHSLVPAVMRSLMDPEILQTLFKMQMKAGSEIPSIQVKRESTHVLIMIATEEGDLSKRIQEKLAPFNYQSSELATSKVRARGVNYLGYIYRSHDFANQQTFCEAVQDCFSTASSLAVR